MINTSYKYTWLVRTILDAGEITFEDNVYPTFQFDYIGIGNSNADILIVGKEMAINKDV